MGINTLLLIVIIWLLWTIHQDLTENNERQRSIKAALSKLANRFEQTPAEKTSTSENKTITQESDKEVTD